MKMQQTWGGWVFGSAGRLRVCRFRTRTSAVARMPGGLLIVLGVVAALLAMPSRADEVSFFRIGTGSTSGTYFPVGGLIASARLPGAVKSPWPLAIGPNHCYIKRDIRFAGCSAGRALRRP